MPQILLIASMLPSEHFTFKNTYDFGILITPFWREGNTEQINNGKLIKQTNVVVFSLG
jgi:hypothetical protein